MTLPNSNKGFLKSTQLKVNTLLATNRKFTLVSIGKTLGTLGLALGLIACGSTPTTLNTASTADNRTLLKETPTSTTHFEQKGNPRLKQLLIAEFNLHRGNLNAGFESYFALAEEEGDLTAISRAADIAVAMNNLFLIEKASKLWLSLEANNPRPYQLNYSIQINYQRETAAKALIESALLNQVDIQFIHDEINKNARKSEQITSIKKGLIQLNQAQPDNIEIIIALARINFLEGDFDGALAKSEKLKEHLGEANLGVESYLILAFSQNQSDQLKDAIESLELALSYHKDNLRLLTPLLNFLILDHQVESSQDHYQNANLNDDESIQLSLNYIGQLIENKEQALALEILKQLNYQDSGLADQFYYLEANALASLDQKEEAISLLLKTSGHLNLNAVEQAAVWLYDLNDANRINEMVISRLGEQKNLDMVLNICFLHEDKGRLDLADQLLSDTLDIYKNANSLRYKRALLADKRGFWLETKKELTYLLSLEPQNPQYLNALGYTLLQYTQNYDEAMALIEQAYQINGEDPAIIDSLGWGHYLLGNTDQAIFYLKKAWNLLKDPEVGAHFGEALWHKNPEQANLIWLQALDNEQDNGILKDTIKRLNPAFDFPEQPLTTPSYTDVAQEHTP